MSHLSDEELISMVASGDRGAMDVLVARYHSKLLDFAARYLGDRETAADIAQKTLVRVFQSSGAYEVKASFKTWLYTIALNLARDEYRRRERRKESLSSDVSDENDLADADDLESIALNRVASVELWESVKALPEQQGLAIVLKFRYELTYEEISEVMNASAGTVKSWVHYGLRTLRKSLESVNCGGRE